MRTSLSAAAMALGGSLALAALVVPTAASAAPGEGACVNLGVAGKYGEFIEGDDTHSPDAEGAVAVGGNADFSHGGFTVGNELTAAEVAALPGGNALVVGGNLIQNGAHVQVMKGRGVVAGQVIGGGQLEGVAKGASPIDFAAEFAGLRALSADLAKTAGAAPTADGRTLTFTGADARANVFTVSADTLQKANEIRLKVPAGSSTVITVTGGGYDQTKAPTSAFLIWDNAKKAYVLDDKLQSADGGAERARLLWNFPAATKITKHSGNAWPGSILAPNAAFDLGRGGPVNGSVWAKSLTGSGGAETHHYPFEGCLPGTTVPPASPSPSPSGSTGASQGPTPSSSAPTPGGGTGSPAPGGSGSPAPSGPAGATPAPSASHGGSGGSGGGGGLAFTGAEGLVPLTVGGAAVLGVGGALAYKARRKKAASS
ncbi:choice-of-anchor A family protein [Kitasatospora sp. NPDC059646]|uniref:choice-of-anchor A family protein n=1 Tax=Kitasatospora sp. NPDC059646 TaxID=3346893 RepID=UPI003679404C